MKPSRPPEEVLRRVLKFSRLNGWSVAIFAGLCTLVSLAMGDPVGIAVSLLVTVGGAIEVRGYRMLKRRNVDGLRWLIRSQLVVLGTIWAYALSRLLSFDAGYIKDQAIPEARAWLGSFGLDMDGLLSQAGVDSREVVPLVRLFFVILYGSVLLVTLLYQGGLFLYYRWRGPAVEIALQPPPVVPGVAASTSPADDYLI